MKISFINYNIKNSSKNTSFKAHKDFYRLAKDYDILASNYFRRGRMYGAASNKYPDVINSLKGIFTSNNEQKNILIGGVGRSQEPFSMLAVIKHLINQEPIADKVELNTIDLQSRPTDKTLFKYSYVDDLEPKYVKDSFVRDEGEKYGFATWMHYRVKNDIYEFLKKTYKNNNKSHWDARIQEVVKDLPNESFDIISVNNTLGYIKDEPIILDTIKHLIRTLKSGGIFITDPFSRFNKACENKTFEIYDGIYKKY